MQGLHLTADLTHCQCDSAWLTDASRLLDRCALEVIRAGLQPVNQLAHSFPATEQGPGGVTATVFPGLAHMLMLEPGWEAVAEAIAGFVARA